MEIFSYLPVLVGIRNSDFTPIVAKGTVNSHNKEDIHKRLLIKLSNMGYPAAMVFENELFLLRDLGNITNNEIKTLLTTNNTWDIIILSPFTINSSPINGYNILRKIDDTSTFFYSNIYIASSRFMQKIKNNNLSIIESYIYTNPFLDNLSTNPKHKQDLYTVGIVSNIDTLKEGEVKYSWNELDV